MTLLVRRTTFLVVKTAVLLEVSCGGPLPDNRTLEGSKGVPLPDTLTFTESAVVITEMVISFDWVAASTTVRRMHVSSKVLLTQKWPLLTGE